jgi:AcrR family transcriptional regulator
MAGYVRAAEREAQLLAAAKTVLVRDGYQALTLRTVAKEAGIGLSTLQYVFRTRADLVQALVDKVTEDAGFRRPAFPVGGLRSTLADVAEWYGRAVLSDPGMRELLRADYSAGLSRHGPEPEDYPAGRPLFEGIATDIIQHLHDDGPERWAVPWQTVAALAGSGFAGLTYGYLRTGDLAYYQDTVAHLIDATVALADPRPRSAT